MSDEIQRQALARSIAIRLQLLTHAELRVVDDVVIRLCQRASERPRATEAIDELIAGVEAQLAEHDRRHDALHEAARDEMVPPTRPRYAPEIEPWPEAPRTRTMANYIPPPVVRIGMPGDDMSDSIAGLALDQHLTRATNDSAALALAEVPRDRDEDLEVELEWDLRDAEAG